MTYLTGYDCRFPSPFRSGLGFVLINWKSIVAPFYRQNKSAGDTVIVIYEGGNAKSYYMKTSLPMLKKYLGILEITQAFAN